MDTKSLADLRRDYSLQELSKSSVAADPFVQFANWFDEYMNSDPLEPNAMTLSTVGRDNRPSSRVVLLKGFDPEGFVFYTNYESKKAEDLSENPNAVLHFFWPELERQINITGTAVKVSREESESYFKSRPIESRIGAWASKQSSVLVSREELTNRLSEIRKRFDGEEIPCPQFWGGYRVTPDRFEFWQGRQSRLHDRIVYSLDDGVWHISRLSP